MRHNEENIYKRSYNRNILATTMRTLNPNGEIKGCSYNKTVFRTKQK